MSSDASSSSRSTNPAPLLQRLQNALGCHPGLTLLMWLGLGLMILPFWMMISISLGDSAEYAKTGGIAGGLIFLPQTLHWENYTRLFEKIPMLAYFINSTVVAVVTTVLHVLLAAMAGYGFARFRFQGQAFLFLVFLGTLMIPPQVNIIPLFFFMKQLHVLDTMLALIIPGMFGAFGVFLFRQWFKGIPVTYEEAAQLDGCTPWQTFWKVMLPMATPPMATLSIFVFISSWNSLMWPIIALHSESVKTLPVGIASLKESFRDVTDWPLLMAAATVALLPVVLVFMVAQRQFIQGMMAGGVKE